MVNSNYGFCFSALLLAALLMAFGCTKSPTASDDAPAKVPTVPIAADSLDASIDISGAVLLSWLDRSSNETGFTAVRRKLPGAAKDTVVLDTLPPNSTSYRDIDVQKGTTYRYTVGVFNTVGGNGSTNYVDITIPTTPPALGAPSNLRALREADSLTLSWDDNSSKEEGFELHITTGPFGGGRGNDTLFFAADTRSTKLRAPTGGSYSFRVRAFRKSDYSAFSNSVRIDFANETLPDPPTNLQMQVSGREVLLFWTDNATDETGYEIQYSTRSDFISDYTKFHTAADSSRFRVIFARNTPQAIYYFRVRAENANGSSSFSNVVSDLVPADDRADLFVEAVQPDDWPTTISQGGTFTLSGWSITNGGETDAITDFEVFLLPVGQILNPSQHTVIHQYGVPIQAGRSQNLSYLSVTIPPGSPNGQYWLQIAVDRNGQVDESDEANNGKLLTIDVNTPNRPDLIIEPDEQYGFLVLPREIDAGSWALVARWYVKNIGPTGTGLFSAGLYLSTDSNITKTDMKLKEVMIPSLPSGSRVAVSADSVLIPPGLTSGYYYVGALADNKSEITEVYENNNSLAIDLEVNGIVINTPPSAPSNLEVNVLNRTASLTWNDNSSDELGFRVQLIGDSPYAVDSVYTLPPNSKSLQISALKIGTHHLRVRAYNAYGNSAYTSPVDIEVVNGTSTGTLKIINNLSGGGSNKVLRLRVGPDDNSVLNFNSTEMLEPENYCAFASGRDISPGEWMIVDVSNIGANYTFHIGLGLWAYDLIECPGNFAKQMWYAGPETNFDLYYVFIHLDMAGHTAGQLTYSIEYDADDNIVLTDGVHSYPFRVLVNQDPISW